MKIRYWVIGYTAIMLVILWCFLSAFRKEAAAGRDMVFYNEQRILVETEIAQGIERDAVEQKYNCEIILRLDENYEIDLQDALQKEALVLDYFQEDILIGKIIWNDEERHYQLLKEDLQEDAILMWGFILLAGYFYWHLSICG